MKVLTFLGQGVLLPVQALSAVSGLPHWMFLLGWLGFWSLIDFALMGVDKTRATKNAWRIPEKTLWLFALLGGAIGGYIGMQTFRHKTRHNIFRFGMPALIVFQILVVFWLLCL